MSWLINASLNEIRQVADGFVQTYVMASLEAFNWIRFSLHIFLYGGLTVYKIKWFYFQHSSDSLQGEEQTLAQKEVCTLEFITEAKKMFKVYYQ